MGTARRPQEVKLAASCAGLPRVLQTGGTPASLAHVKGFTGILAGLLYVCGFKGFRVVGRTQKTPLEPLKRLWLGKTFVCTVGLIPRRS